MHSMLLRSMALRTKRTKPILLYKSDFNETCLSDLEFKYTSQLRYCRTQIDSGASSVSDGDSRQRTLPICSPRRTTNLPRTYVAQILKRLKECLNQQKIVEISYQESLETPNWLHSGRSYQGAWRTIQPSPETGRSLSFPWAWKKKKYLRHFSLQSPPGTDELARKAVDGVRCNVVLKRNFEVSIQVSRRCGRKLCLTCHAP